MVLSMPGFLADVLSRSNNYGMMQSIVAALDLRMPPTTFIYTARQPDDPWDTTDKKIAVAVHILNKQTCPQCGQPLWICRSDDANVDFVVKTATCYATQALEKARAKRTKTKKELKPGEFEYVEPKMLFGKPFPTRADWLENLS